MVVLLDGKRFEAALVKMACSHAMSVSMVPLRVGQGQPADETGKQTVGLGPGDQMPMVRHQAVGEQPRLESLDPFG